VEKMTRWLVLTLDDVEPCLEGPFKTERARVASARAHRKDDPEKRDGLFGLDISDSGSPEIFAFPSGKISPKPEAA
jgi:hypothetical protein